MLLSTLAINRKTEMKIIFAALALVLMAGCYKANPDKDSPFNRPNDPNNPEAPKTVGFTKHAWCYAYSTGTRQIQERFMFNDGGVVNYHEFEWVAQQRGQQVFSANGTWLLNGTVLQMDINGKRLVYQIAYNVRDQVTGRERVHIYMNGNDAPYDPCN